MLRAPPSAITASGASLDAARDGLRRMDAGASGGEPSRPVARAATGCPGPPAGGERRHPLARLPRAEMGAVLRGCATIRRTPRSDPQTARAEPRNPVLAARTDASTGATTAPRSPSAIPVEFRVASGNRGCTAFPRPRSRRGAVRPGSSVGTSVRLKSGRSAVRPRPWPPQVAAGQTTSLACGFDHPVVQ